MTLLATRLHAAARNTLLSVFVMSTPVGIAIGLGISAAAADSSAVVPLIISFAAGTIAYTGAFEIILPELGPGHGGGSHSDTPEHSHELLMLAAFSSQPLEAFKLPGLSARTRRREAHMQAQYGGGGRNPRALSMDSVMMEGHFPEEYVSPALPGRRNTGCSHATLGSVPLAKASMEHLDLSSVARLGHAPGSPLQSALLADTTQTLHSSPLILASSAPSAPPSPLGLRASKSAYTASARDRTGHSTTSGSGSLNGGGGRDVETGRHAATATKQVDSDRSPQVAAAAGGSGTLSPLCALAAKVVCMLAGFVFMSVLAIWA